MTYAIMDFHKEYEDIIKIVPTYRLGQHFINKFIKQSSSEEMCDLWNEWDSPTANLHIYEIIERYNWDLNDLPVISEEKL